MAIDPSSGASCTAGNQTIDTLNTFLRGELAAVETYRQAIERIDDGALCGALDICQRSHEMRVATLQSQIERLGGQPEEGAGLWGAFADLLEGDAERFGANATLAALEEGEFLGVRMYRSDLDKLDGATKALVENELLAAQRRSLQAMTAIKRSLH